MANCQEFFHSITSGSNLVYYLPGWCRNLLTQLPLLMPSQWLGPWSSLADGDEQHVTAQQSNMYGMLPFICCINFLYFINTTAYYLGWYNGLNGSSCIVPIVKHAWNVAISVLHQFFIFYKHNSLLLVYLNLLKSSLVRAVAVATVINNFY